MRTRATIRDVAELAGCSVSTVSRVLNGAGRASAATRARVQAAAEALAFRFDPIGRSLQSRRTRAIGVMAPSLSNPVFADAIEGAQRAAEARGYHLLLACANYEPEAEAETLGALLARRVDGVLLTVSDAADSPALDAAREAGAPFVLIFNQPGAGTPAVTCDNRAAAEVVADRMLALGHRDVAFVAGRFRSSDRSKQRFEGFRAAYRAAGAPEPALLEVDYRALSHRDALRQVLAARPSLSGFFCSNDMLALTVIGDLRALGRRTPEDVSVVGFDGIAVGAVVEPNLATIATPSSRMGAEAAGRLIDAIESGGTLRSEPVLLPHEFRPGRSLGRAPGGPAGTGAATPRPASIPERK